MSYYCPSISRQHAILQYRNDNCTNFIDLSDDDDDDDDELVAEDDDDDEFVAVRPENPLLKHVSFQDKGFNDDNIDVDVDDNISDGSNDVQLDMDESSSRCRSILNKYDNNNDDDEGIGHIVGLKRNRLWDDIDKASSSSSFIIPIDPVRNSISCVSNDLRSKMRIMELK